MSASLADSPAALSEDLSTGEVTTGYDLKLVRRASFKTLDYLRNCGKRQVEKGTSKSGGELHCDMAVYELSIEHKV